VFALIDINTKAAEFRENAEACGLDPVRGPQMDSYVTNSINGNGTSKFDNVTQVMSAKEAACMKIPGSVDEPSNAVSKWINGLGKSFQDAKASIGTSLEDLKANAPSPTGMIKTGQTIYQKGIDGKIDRALNTPSSFK
jgi:hypothetical protein